MDLVSHPAMAHLHPTGHHRHPETEERLRHLLAAFNPEIEGGRASRAAIERVHDPAYVDRVESIAEECWLDGDTIGTPTSYEAARLAAGCTIRAVELGGFALVRPPGHHALADSSMGFCIFGNAVVAARHAQSELGIERVAIVDWDVHHGNGTQDIFWDDPTVLFASVHQYPYYPGTGAPTEIGGPHARGATINVGLPQGSGDADYAAVFDHVFLPALDRFEPDLILVSAGFDAYQHDPLAGMRVTKAGFAALARRLRAAADRNCDGRIIAVLEGGYDLDGIAGGMTETLAAFLAEQTTIDPTAPMPTGLLQRAAIEGTLDAHKAVAA